MPDLNNKPDGDGIEDLRPSDRKETEEIIKEIAAETQDGKPKEEVKPEPTPKKEEPKVEPKPEDKPKEDDKKPDNEQSRKKVKLIPAWVHETAKSNWQKEKGELEAKITAASKVSVKEEIKPEGDKTQAEIDAALRGKTDALAKKFGREPDEVYEEALAIRETLRPETSKMEIPKEITEGIKKIDEYKQDQETAAEEALFAADFTAKILPLIKAEYGDDVPATTIEDVKEKVKARAYSEEYGKVPLSTIYKGEDEFRSLIPEKQRGSEKSRGGYNASEKAFKSDEIDLTTEQSDEAVEKMTPSQFDTYSDNMAKREKKR